MEWRLARRSLRIPDIQYSSREIVRQQWNFSPSDSVRETEDYVLELSGVKVLELMIVPNKSGGEVRGRLGRRRDHL